MPDTSLPSFVDWSSFPFEGQLRVKELDDPVAVEPPRMGEDKAECAKCQTPDSDYIWVNENWRVRSMDRPSGLPMVLILESRSHLDLGDLPNMLAAELGVMTVRLERAIRSLDGVARVHVNRWGDGAAHLHLWFMARPYGRLQLRGTFLTLWDEILPAIRESQWRENLALIAAWLAEFGGQPLAQPPRIEWKTPSSLEQLGPDTGFSFDTEDEIADAGPAAAGGDPGAEDAAGKIRAADRDAGHTGSEDAPATASGTGGGDPREGAGQGAGQSADQAGSAAAEPANGATYQTPGPAGAAPQQPRPATGGPAAAQAAGATGQAGKGPAAAAEAPVVPQQPDVRRATLSGDR